MSDMDTGIDSLDSLDEPRVITIVTSDGARFDLTEVEAMHSNFITVAMTDKEATEIPIPHSSVNFRVALQFMKHYGPTKPNPIESPARYNVMSENADEWSGKFADRLFSHGPSGWDVEDAPERKEAPYEFYNLIMMVNAMDMPDLLRLLCCKVATVVKGQTPDTIRNRLDPEDRRTKKQSENK